MPAPPGVPYARVELRGLPDERLLLAFAGPGGVQPQAHELSTVTTLLAVLADERLAPLWPALTEFAGPDLARQRDRFVRVTGEGVEHGRQRLQAGRSHFEAQAVPEVLALIQRSNALAAAGRMAQGVAELAPHIAVLAASGDTDDAYSEFQLRSQIARLHHIAGRTDVALAEIAKGLANPALTDDYRLNYDVNRAAMLAEAGRHAEALEVLGTAVTTLASLGAGDGPTLSGADLQFGWIRACALSGLGRTAEARDAIRPLLNAGPDYLRTRVRALICMGDDDGVAAEIVKELESGVLTPASGLWLQPAYSNLSSWEAAFRRVVARPEVQAAMKGRIRILPAQFAPAMGSWDRE